MKRCYNIYSLYLSEGVLKFGGYETMPEQAYYIVVGMPLDYTSSFTPGTRFAPYYIRIASQNIEFNTLAGIDMDKYPGSDLGDIPPVIDIQGYINRGTIVIKGLLEEFKKTLLILGGEHTITLSIIRAHKNRAKKTCLLVFDAHFDYRNKYLESRVNHATVMRRISEILEPEHIYFVGVRAYSIEEELNPIKKQGLNYATSLDIEKYGIKTTIRKIEEWLAQSNCSTLHLSIDMDVVDPSYAPGVSNPEPLGIRPYEVIEIARKTILAFPTTDITIDIVEVNPLRDCNNITSILAAKIAIELLAAALTREKKTSTW